MAFCASCGNQVDGQFCAKCGASVAGGGGGGGGAAAQGLPTNTAAALCYLVGWITGVIFLVLAPYNQDKAIRFNAFQSIFLSIGYIVLWIVVGAVLPFSLTLFVTPLLSLAILGLWLFLMWKTYQGEKILLPVIGDLAQKQA